MALWLSKSPKPKPLTFSTKKSSDQAVILWYYTEKPKSYGPPLGCLVNPRTYGPTCPYFIGKSQGGNVMKMEVLVLLLGSVGEGLW